MPTIRDVARKARVSVSTASLALNDDPRVHPDTKAKILLTAKTLNYQPSRNARALSKGQTYTLQILNPLKEDSFSSSFFARFVTGANEVATKLGYTLGVTLPHQERPLMATLKRLVGERWCDGIVLLNPTTDKAVIHFMQDKAFPFVVLGKADGIDTCRVDSDNIRVAQDAAAHLLRQARVPLVFLNGPATQTFTVERREGVKLALQAAGFSQQDVIWLEGLGNARQSATLIVNLLAKQQPFRSVLTISDEMASGVLRALRIAGKRVPEDVAVVGMNNDDLAEFLTPQLTSIDLNAQALGQRAVSMLHQCINGNDSYPKLELVPHQLVIRESSA